VRSSLQFDLLTQHGTIAAVMRKTVLELLVCFLYPIPVVLIWINLPRRHDIDAIGKAVWAIFGLFPLVPFVYILTGGEFW
jgi:hypothetical protein